MNEYDMLDYLIGEGFIYCYPESGSRRYNVSKNLEQYIESKNIFHGMDCKAAIDLIEERLIDRGWQHGHD